MAGRDLAADHDALTQAVRAGGALALERFGQPGAVWEKSPGDPVSEADLAVNAVLETRLKAHRPDYGWLSEEGGADGAPPDPSAARTWVADPIDGTRAFLKGRPHFTVCAALIEAGAPIAGAIFNPATDEFFEAVLGGGARLNGAPIAASAKDEIDGCRMLGAADMFRHPDWPVPWPQMEVTQRNSIAYRMALVACGAFDAAIALKSKHVWDTAAGTLIAQEAGAHVSDHLGRPLAFEPAAPLQPSLVCAAPGLADDILGRLAFLTDLDARRRREEARR